MSFPTEAVEEAILYGQRRVRAGDAVCIKFPGLFKEMGDAAPDARHDTLVQFLGNGPFIIASIKRELPSGKILLYLRETRAGYDTAVYAEDLM